MYMYICMYAYIYIYIYNSDSLSGSSVQIGTIQRRLAWPLRKDDTRKSRSTNILYMVLIYYNRPSYSPLYFIVVRTYVDYILHIMS